MTPLTRRQDQNRVDIDQLFRALSHPTRRRVLVSLMGGDPRGRREFELTEFVPDGPDRERTTVSLHHTHLPHLDDAGFVGWDRGTEPVSRGANFEAISPLLELTVGKLEERPDDRP